ncbi:MAG: acetyl-CoA carboxylase biotin carboxylase subunit [Thermoleophilia bacterium]
MFRKVLVANRGEIAIRVFRTLREMGIPSVAVYSEADRDSLFVTHADEAYLLGPGPSSESYLALPRLLAVAAEARIDAVHPGYGFLAENAPFARALDAAGITWIGPPPDAIDAMGSKVRARALMQAAGVPIVPGVTEPVPDVEAARVLAKRIGYPVAVKASAGGGGKGFRVAADADALEDAFEGAVREGERFFADGAVYLERYLPNPRHVEIQVLADAHGTTIHLGERDCSIQRRHQKLVEETPSPVVSDDLRRRMGEASVRAAQAVGYRSAGTLEYLVSGEEFFFLEMNTRIQVEHTVTEVVTGVDLVREQVRIAAGEPMSISQDDVVGRGHAFECRINAEDAAARFTPSPGRITAYREPSGPGVRVDSGVRAGSAVPEIYDPMVAKLIAWDVDRETARLRMLRALSEYVIEGPTTLIPFHRWLLSQPEFIEGGACHELLARLAEEPTEFEHQPAPAGPSDHAEADGARTERRITAEVDGRRFEVLLTWPEPDGAPQPGRRAKPRSGRPRAAHGPSAASSGNEIVSPMQGTVLKVLVEVGQMVAAGSVVCIVEAMKMENEITAHRDGAVAAIPVAEGGSVVPGDVVVVLG